MSEELKLLTIYSKEELEKIQDIETNCLRAIIEICEREKIEYFLIGGTALGAVRHGGFIPWDDDIDVGMTRENYNKFLEIADNFLPTNYHLQSPYNEQNSPYTYSKVRIDDTSFVEYCNRKIKMHHGVYVDIFPFDEVPDDKKKNKRQFRKYQKWTKLFVYRQSLDVSEKPINGTARIKALIRRFVHFAVQLLPRKMFLKKLDKIATQYNGTSQAAVACLCFPIWKTEYVSKTDLYPLKNIKFGGLTAKIAYNENAYLTTHYGDYMQLPPEEKRFGHKPYFVDLEKSYKEYVK